MGPDNGCHYLSFLNVEFFGFFFFSFYQNKFIESKFQAHNLLTLTKRIIEEISGGKVKEWRN